MSVDNNPTDEGSSVIDTRHLLASIPSGTEVTMSYSPDASSVIITPTPVSNSSSVYHSPSVSASSIPSMSFSEFIPYHRNAIPKIQTDESPPEFTELVPSDNQVENARRILGARYRFESFVRGTFGKIMKMKLKPNKDDEKNEHPSKIPPGTIVGCMKITPRRDARHQLAFERELYALRTLSHHDHIVSYIDSWADDDYFYLMMNFLEGKDLFSYMISERIFLDDESDMNNGIIHLAPEEEDDDDYDRYYDDEYEHRSQESSHRSTSPPPVHIGLTEDEIREILYILIMTMNFCQSHGFIHRDLKPENIVLPHGDIFQLKVIDFETAIRLGYDQHDVVDQDDVGTKEYMAPERFRSRVSFASEIWTVGVMAFEMLTQYRPFEHRSEILDYKDNVTWPADHLIEDPGRANGHARIPSLGRTASGNDVRSVSDEAKKFVEMCLKVDPTKRATWTELLESEFIRNVPNPHLAEKRQQLTESYDEFDDRFFITSPMESDRDENESVCSYTGRSRESSFSMESSASTFSILSSSLPSSDIVSRGRSRSANSYATSKKINQLQIPSKNSFHHSETSSVTSPPQSSKPTHRKKTLSLSLSVSSAGVEEEHRSTPTPPPPSLSNLSRNNNRFEHHRNKSREEIPWTSEKPHYFGKMKKFKMGHKRRKSISIVE